ncbi:hypothetical protein LTR91_012272 [Friedmanniomyces endolithicus]|uniref:COX assembly mitochondrial protein n=1 Tax=Friedmanniomyces endolithicus TaxID=329885 RepID=A0AAN6QQT6_9PEZI|nr:hypothetical protein LTR94_005983 [Friedmanniomyces endolithicus]KAK0789507.1 hypothetical protein LTR59_009577 [Friedmanniomyces endolithicus]KAK0857283.1 hypothetical protein LTR03_000773 [Friedmanniomyces endolithicus]KAK0865518.1 hypothetical protein LTS02_005320 [Friedmanniomyces endolithicus]KAK0883420.1 hypothetical protein LTR87_002696 [Friedmanniomyces endolithicus]
MFMQEFCVNYHDMAMAMTLPPKEPPTARPSPLPSRNPLPLSSSQEAQVKELYHKRVRTKCADEVRDFASCCSSRTFTATIMCRGQQKAMNTCMKQYATQDEQDSAREEWFATMDKRREEREQKEAKKKIDEVFWREWWAKDPNEKPGQTGKGGP